MEKKKSGKELYHGKIINLTLDEVTLDNGETAMREVVHHPGGAAVAALTENRELVLVKQFRYPFGEELLEIPAGKLEPGEPALPAAKRELEEECGLQAESWEELITIYPTVGYSTEVISVFLAKGLREVPMHPDEDEFVTPLRMPLQEAYEKVLSGEIKDAKTVAAILKLGHDVLYPDTLRHHPQTDQAL